MLTPGGEWVLSLDPNSLDDRAPLMACILLFAYELRWKLQLSTVDRVETTAVASSTVFFNVTFRRGTDATSQVRNSTRLRNRSN